MASDLRQRQLGEQEQPPVQLQASSTAVHEELPREQERSLPAQDLLERDADSEVLSGVELVNRFEELNRQDHVRTEADEVHRRAFDEEGTIRTVVRDVTRERIQSDREMRKRKNEREKKRKVSEKAEEAISAQKPKRAEFADTARRMREVIVSADRVQPSDEESEDRAAALEIRAKKLMTIQFRRLDAMDISVMSLSDKELIEKYPKLIEDLDVAVDLLKYFDTEDGGPDYSKYMPYSPKVMEQLREKAVDYQKQREYLEAKMTVLSSSYFSLLRKQDMEKMTLARLEMDAELYKDSNRGLSAYLRSLAKLKRLNMKKESKNIAGVYADGAAMDLFDGTDLGRDVRRNGDTKVETTNKAKLIGFKVTHVSELHVGALSTEEIEQHERDNVSEEKFASKKEQDAAEEAALKDLDKGSQLDVGASYMVTADASLFEGEVRQKRTMSGGSTTMGYMSAKLGNLNATGKLALSLFKEGKVRPELLAEGNITAAALKSEVGGEAKLNVGEWGKIGRNILGVAGKASAAVATAYAKGSAKVGKWVSKKGVERTGLKFGGKAGTNLFEGKADASFTVLGLKVKLAVSGSVGFGAEFGIKSTGTGGSFSIGGALGLGGGLKISLDWAEMTKYFDGLKKKRWF